MIDMLVEEVVLEVWIGEKNKSMSITVVVPHKKVGTGVAVVVAVEAGFGEDK